MTEHFSIKAPIQEIFDAYDKLSEGVDAHFAGV